MQHAKRITFAALRNKLGGNLLKLSVLDSTNPMFQILQAMGVHTKKQANDVRFHFFCKHNFFTAPTLVSLTISNFPLNYKYRYVLVTF